MKKNGKLHRNSRTKYKNLIKKFASRFNGLNEIDFKSEQKQLQKQINFGNMNLNFGNSVHINITEQK